MSAQHTHTLTKKHIHTLGVHTNAHTATHVLLMEASVDIPRQSSLLLQDAESQKIYRRRYNPFSTLSLFVPSFLLFLCALPNNLSGCFSDRWIGKYDLIRSVSSKSQSCISWALSLISRSVFTFIEIRELVVNAWKKIIYVHLCDLEKCIFNLKRKLLER